MVPYDVPVRVSDPDRSFGTGSRACEAIRLVTCGFSIDGRLLGRLLGYRLAVDPSEGGLAHRQMVGVGSIDRERQGAKRMWTVPLPQSVLTLVAIAPWLDLTTRWNDDQVSAALGCPVRVRDRAGRLLLQEIRDIAGPTERDQFIDQDVEQGAFF